MAGRAASAQAGSSAGTATGANRTARARPTIRTIRIVEFGDAGRRMCSEEEPADTVNRDNPVNRTRSLTRDKESSRPEIRGAERNHGGGGHSLCPEGGFSPLTRESASRCGTGGKSENAENSRSRRFLLTRGSRNSATGRKAPRVGFEPGTRRLTRLAGTVYPCHPWSSGAPPHEFSKS